MHQRYSPEFKARVLELIKERIRTEQCSGWVACTAVGEALGGISPHTLRNWWKQGRIDRGEAPGLSTAEAEEITKLRKENLELRRANEILRKASAFFAAPLRPGLRIGVTQQREALPLGRSANDPSRHLSRPVSIR